MSQIPSDLYQQVLNFMDEGFYLCEVQFEKNNKPSEIRYLEENPAAVRMTGRRFAGKTLREIHPDYEEKWYQICGDVVLSGNSKRLQQYFGPDQKWFDFYITKVNDDSARRVAIIFKDIADLKSAQHELHENKDLLQSVFDVTYNGLSVLKAVRDEQGELVDMEYIYANQATKRTNKRNDLEGKLYSEVHAGFKGTDYFEVVKRVVETGDPHQYQLRYNFEHLDNWFNIKTVKLNDGVVISFEDISEIKKAEEALRESEQKIAAIIKNLPGAAVYIVDHNLKLLLEDGEALKQDSLALSGLTGKTLYEVQPELAKACETFIRKAISGTSFMHEHSTTNGTFITRGTPLRNKSGEVNEVLIVSYDITERKLAEEALRSSEVRFRTLADTVPQVIWTNDGEGYADYFNERWFKYTGLDYEQSAGLGWQVVVHPEDEISSVSKWQEALAVGEIFDTEYRLRRHDGKYCWFIGRNVPLKDESGRTISWFGSATDIEDLKQAQEELILSEERLRITMDSATDYGIITMDKERKIEKWSSGAFQIFGYRAEEVVGGSADILFTAEDVASGAPQKEMETARDTGRAADERWHQRKDGSRFYASGVMCPIQNSVLTGYVKVLRDTTQQKLFTEELHRLVSERTIELQRSNEDLRQFAHVASHDLKEPVRKIQTFNNRILDEYAETLPAKVKTYAEKIGSSADRMISMIEGVLRYSKLGNTEQVWEKVDISEVIQNIATDLEVLIHQKQALITFGNMPAIKANYTLIYQLFYNLILNSLKFAKVNEPPQINISADQVKQDEKDYVKLVISDNGIGFEPEYNEAIFKTFTRLHPAEDFEGSGLGLALCEKIVERHGGTITATGEPGVGARFIILLPLKMNN